MTHGQQPPRSAGRTFSEMLFNLRDDAKRQDLETFRIEWERVHGTTDLCKRYTSTWPTQLQQWMFEHRSQEWFDGLPPFVQAFLAKEIPAQLQLGQLNNTDPDGDGAVWVNTGAAPSLRLSRYWIAQYLGGAVRSPEDARRGR